MGGDHHHLPWAPVPGLPPMFGRPRGITEGPAGSQAGARTATLLPASSHGAGPHLPRAHTRTRRCLSWTGWSPGDRATLGPPPTPPLTPVSIAGCWTTPTKAFPTGSSCLCTAGGRRPRVCGPWRSRTCRPRSATRTSKVSGPGGCGVSGHSLSPRFHEGRIPIKPTAARPWLLCVVKRI